MRISIITTSENMFISKLMMYYDPLLLHYSSIPHFSKTYGIMLPIVIIMLGEEKSLFPTRSGEVALAAPPWLSSESEDDEPPTHKLEVDACVMAMENVYLQRSKRVPYACT